jgi:deoxyribose-phosphate aldolase
VRPGRRPGRRARRLCVWPRFVAQAKAGAPAGVRVAAVANFPAGGLDMAAAVADARAIVDAGGDEVDLVLPWRALQAGDGPAPLRWCRRCVRPAPAAR